MAEPETPPVVVPPPDTPATAPPPAPPSPAPVVVDQGDKDDALLGKIGQLLDSRHNKLAGRLETALRPAQPPVPEQIDAPTPATADPPAKPKSRYWR